MGEMVEYIFGSLSDMKKLFKSQEKFNRGIVILALVATAYIHVTNSRIEELTEEVEKLKRAEGEHEWHD